jgi:hypothetical protein
MLSVLCLRILASPRIPWYDLRRQTPHFWGGSLTKMSWTPAKDDSNSSLHAAGPHFSSMEKVQFREVLTFLSLQTFSCLRLEKPIVRRDLQLQTPMVDVFCWHNFLDVTSWLSSYLGYDGHCFGLIDEIRTKYSFLSWLDPVERGTTSMSTQGFKRCHLEALLIAIVVWKLSLWQILVPAALIFCHTCSKHTFENLIHSLIWPSICGW